MRAMTSIYLHPEWVALMEDWCGAKAQWLELAGEHGGTIRAVVYRRKGHLFQPPYQPYLGIEFIPTPTSQPARITRQWHEAAAHLIGQLRAAGWSRWLTLPPEISDARPFLWAGLVVTPRYTYYLNPHLTESERGQSPEIPRKAKKAASAGFRIERNQDVDAAMRNMASTESRQQFDYALTKSQLKQALTALGPERLRFYNAYDLSGDPACTLIVLYSPGSVVRDWIAATAAHHLKSGVTQLLRQHLWEDLRTLDIAGFDFCGANIPSVAAAKAEFGGVLVPYYQIEPLGWRYLARQTVRWVTGDRR